MLHLGAFESTKIHGTGQDILGTTRHIERWEHDLRLLESAGIRNLRYSIPWHRIERRPGEFDFSWIDRPMAFIRAHNMGLIADPLHHTSFPDWLTDGFANPHFPELYQRFVEKLARRYDWIEQYTVFNEPLPTTLFCSYTGWWYPHQHSDDAFARMAINVGRAISNVSSMLTKMNPSIRFIHVDTCEGHQAIDKRSESWVDFAKSSPVCHARPGPWAHKSAASAIQLSDEIRCYYRGITLVRGEFHQD
jgi:beta-glucosidase/6-phospho-beta-glucosidase/beta-galactosidase